MPRRKKTKLNTKNYPLNIWRTVVVMPRRYRYPARYCWDCNAFITGQQTKEKVHPNSTSVTNLLIAEGINDFKSLEKWLKQRELETSNLVSFNTPHFDDSLNLNGFRSIPATPKREQNESPKFIFEACFDKESSHSAFTRVTINPDKFGNNLVIKSHQPTKDLKKIKQGPNSEQTSYAQAIIDR